MKERSEKASGKEKRRTANEEKKKANEAEQLNIQIVTFVREFLKKKVQYLIFGYGGKEKWFPDVAVCQK